MSKPYVTSKAYADGILEITFFHPKHNSLPSELLKELASSIAKAGQDASVSLIVLKSAGDRTFCAGASFDELIGIDSLEEGIRFFSGFANVINACRKCPKLIIGRVQGKVIGGGVGLAAAVDYCFATKYASVKLSELNIGIGPFVISPAVERKIGLAAFSHLSLNPNDFLEASWAKNVGLYNEVFETMEEMDEALDQHAKHLATTNPDARSALKRVFWEGCDHWDDLLAQRAAQSGRLVLSEFTKNALKSYK